jgi:hypothetical protein
MAMTPLYDELEFFFERVRPMGVAFVGSARLAISFGRSPDRISGIWEGQDGFVQYHLEERDASIYVSSFGRGRYLVAQFPFEEDCRLRWHPWLAFVRLASAVARILDPPDETERPGDAGVRVPRPRPSPLRALAAEAPLGGRTPDGEIYKSVR